MRIFSFSWWPLVALRVIDKRLYARSMWGRRREIRLDQVRRARLYGGTPRFLAVDTAEGHYAVSFRSRNFPQVLEYLSKTLLIGNEDEDLLSMWRILVAMAAAIPVGALAGYAVLTPPESLLVGAGLALIAGFAAGLAWHLARPERRASTRAGLAIALALLVVAVNLLAIMLYHEKISKLESITSEAMPPAASSEVPGKVNR